MDLSYSFPISKMGNSFLFLVDLDKPYVRHLTWLVPLFEWMLAKDPLT